MARRNQEVALLLQSIAKLLALQGENHYRIRSFEEAARAVDAAPDDVDLLYRTGRLTTLPGVGESIAARVGEYLETGRSSYLEELKRRSNVAGADLLEVPGVGPVRAKLFAERLGITTIPELERAAREHRLRGLPGLSATLEEKIARDAGRLLERRQRVGPTRAA